MKETFLLTIWFAVSRLTVGQPGGAPACLQYGYYVFDWARDLLVRSFEREGEEQHLSRNGLYHGSLP